MARNRVLVVTAYTVPFSFGGGKNAHSLVEYLFSKEVNAMVLCYKEAGFGFVKKILGHITQVAWLNRNIIGKVFSFLWIIPTCLYLGFTSRLIYIVGAHFIGSPFVIIGAKIARNKVVFRSTLQGDDDPATLYNDKSLIGLFRKIAIKHCDIYHAINPHLAAQHKTYSKGRQPIVSVCQGIDTSKFFTAHSNFNFKSKANRLLTIISVGHLTSRKGYIEIFDYLEKLEIPFKYIVIADNILPKGYAGKEVIKDYNYISNYGKTKLGDKLEIIQGSSNIGEYYRDADILLHNSSREGTPNVVMEAMACGVVPIVRELYGFKNFLIFQDETGYLYTDAGDALNYISNLYNNPNLMQRIASNSARFAKENFSFEKTWQEIQKALNHV